MEEMSKASWRKGQLGREGADHRQAEDGNPENGQPGERQGEALGSSVADSDLCRDFDGGVSVLRSLMT